MGNRQHRNPREPIVLIKTSEAPMKIIYRVLNIPDFSSQLWFLQRPRTSFLVDGEEDFVACDGGFFVKA